MSEIKTLCKIFSLSQIYFKEKEAAFTYHIWFIIFSECSLLISLNTLSCRINCHNKRLNREWRVKNLSFSLILNSLSGILHCQFKMCPSSSLSRNVHIHIKHTFLFVLHNKIILLWLFILIWVIFPSQFIWVYLILNDCMLFRA